MMIESIQINFASPATIREWATRQLPDGTSFLGQVKTSDTINYRTFKPEKDGLFCEEIFGIKQARRHWIGCIFLQYPVTHIWFRKGSYLSLFLGRPKKELESLAYCYAFLDTKDGCNTGSEAIRFLIQNRNISRESARIRTAFSKWENRRIRRLRLLHHSLRVKPEWMVLSILPILPPDLRPIVQLDGGQFASSDLNDLYRLVINRNKRCLDAKQAMAPDLIRTANKRLLQDSVDALLDTRKRARLRPLRSLAEMLKGKQGRFRQNLLGKRVDYSGRSVIVVGPHLKIFECGLPKEMALELFQPFVIRQLLQTVPTIRAAKTLINAKDDSVWNILADVIHHHPVLLNRAPTLHRLSMQAFEPRLVDGKAIYLHPLVCPAFNADFDGDQMAVHVPLSAESQQEARQLMLACDNLLSPATGQPITVPSQDMVLGLYYLTAEKPGIRAKYNLPIFNWKQAYFQNKLDLHTWVWTIQDKMSETPTEIRIDFNGKKQIIGPTSFKLSDQNYKMITVGQLIFQDILKTLQNKDFYA